MQAIKEKLNDMSHMRKAKAEAKEEENEEKEIAKTRVQVAKEVRMAREAEAAMDLHVNKAAEKVARQEAKHAEHGSAVDQFSPDATQDPYGGNLYGDGYSNTTRHQNQAYGEDLQVPNAGGATAVIFTNNPSGGTGNLTNRAGGPPSNNLL